MGHKDFKKFVFPVLFICLVSAATMSCGSSQSQTTPPSTRYTIGGTVSGLSGTLVLQNNGGNNLTRTANGSFAFTTALSTGSAYSVTVSSQPSGQICTVTNGSGTVGSSNITNIQVGCTNATYTVGGTVYGINGTAVLQNNNGDNLSVSAAGSFTFNTSMANGAAYSVTVLTQPSGQTCSVTGGSGTISGDDVIGVHVTCSNNLYTVGGTVSGLNGTAVLQNNGDDNHTITANGSFTFDIKIAHGSTYSVTVLTQPSGQTCTVAHGSGTIGAANVTNVAVTCTANFTYTNETVLYSFGAAGDGIRPYTTNLIEASDGYIYGTTDQGGDYDGGTIFRFDPTDPAGTYTMLHSFANTVGPDGYEPVGNLIQASDGMLYGVTFYGGTESHGGRGGGTIYRFDPADFTNTYEVLHSFGVGNDGWTPYNYAGLVQASDGDLYGTTINGGSTGGGTIYKITTSGVYTMLHSFNYANEGYGPEASFVEGNDGMLYSTTIWGGSNDDGTIFRFDPTGNTVTVLYSFNYANGMGQEPETPLILGNDGNFYGTIDNGGANNDGIIYKITPSGVMTLLYSFDTATGDSPWGNLLQANDSYIYGTTAGGGANSEGTIYRFDPADPVNSFTVLHDFAGGSDGAEPFSGLIQASDGKLYGTTELGGTNDWGTIYVLQ
jgi:uncharacterized repeat protein (TIGR03803 family)